MSMQAFRERAERLRANVTQVIHGKDEVVELCLAALFARGHLLLEDVPGVGKTTLASTIASSIHCSFQRIQFTSDMLPSDILGVTIFDQDKREFEFRQGPLFANVVLADEINRTSPKTQSAMLEAMNTGRVSMDRQVHELPRPFMVLATQNPIEFHGTFPLPKSQMDRFLLRLRLGYPSRDNEIQVLREQQLGSMDQGVEAVLSDGEVLEMQAMVSRVKVDRDLLDYMVRIAEATRQSPRIELGCSPRGTIALRRSAQSLAALRGRDFVTPDDIKEVAVPVLAHRMQFARTFETSGFSHAEDEAMVREVIAEVPVPL